MSIQHLAAQAQRWRGVILELVYDGHRKQFSRMDDLALWGMMRNLQYDVSRNDVIAQLQDLQDRSYLRFKQQKDDRTGEVSVKKIEITSKGRDLVERVAEQDPAVTLL